MYDTTNLDELLAIAFVAIPIIYLAIRGELFERW
jgi:hypothetical protein